MENKTVNTNFSIRENKALSPLQNFRYELRRRFCEECDKLEINARGEIKPKEEF